MVLKGELLHGEEELITPPIVVAGVEVENDPNKIPDVLHSDCLGIKVSDGGSFMREQGVVKIVVVGDAIFLIRGGFVIVECAGGGTLLFGASLGLVSARCGSITLQSGGLGFLFGSGDTC